MIVPMKKATLVCLKEEREALLLALQQCGELMPISSENAPPIAEGELQQRVRHSEELLKRVKPYRTKKGMFAGRAEVELPAFLEKKAEAETLHTALSDLLEKLGALQTEIAAGEASVAQLSPWLELDAPVQELSGRYSSYFSGWIPPREMDTVSAALAESGGTLKTFGQGPEGIASILLCYRDDRSLLLEKAKALGFAEAALPISEGRVPAEYETVSVKIKQKKAEAEQTTEEIRELSKKADELELLSEQYQAESDRAEAPVSTTDETVFLEGWVRSDRTEKLEKAIRSVTDAYALELRDPLPEEVPPTATKNNRFTTQFETITDMFSRPRYGGLDPNPVMAPWYWIIFGMMMGDVGYGVLMVIFIFLFKKLKKPKGEMGKLVNVLYYSSATTILFGVLFGSYFGETWHPILFGPLDDPIAMLIFSLMVGVLHIFTGMILKMVDDIRSGHLWDAVFDQLSWMLIIGGIVFAFFDMVMSAFHITIAGWDTLRTVGIAIAIFGALLVLFTAGRAKKGFGKVTGGLLGLYGVSNYLSDILSYARIMALSLATCVIGMVMNLLAGLVIGIPIAGILFACLIYAVGHIFNLAMSLLSAYVHDSRLQYIEFYNKFYDGGGEAFTPLAIRTQYIDVVHKKTEIK